MQIFAKLSHIATLFTLLGAAASPAALAGERDCSKYKDDAVFASKVAMIDDYYGAHRTAEISGEIGVDVFKSAALVFAAAQFQGRRFGWTNRTANFNKLSKWGMGGGVALYLPKLAENELLQISAEEAPCLKAAVLERRARGAAQAERIPSASSELKKALEAASSPNETAPGDPAASRSQSAQD